MNNQEQQIAVVPVEIQALTMAEASELLKKNDPTQLPQWQMHGTPLVDGNGEIRQVMIKLDRYREPTIVVPRPGPFLVK